MPSAFISNNQRTVHIDGIDEELTIQPLHADALSNVRYNRQNGHHDAANKIAVNNGLVLVGEETSDDWSQVLSPKAMRLIADKTVAIS